MRTMRMACAAISLLLAAAPVFAAVNTDQIVDGAITTPKIADGAVTTQKLAVGAVTDEKISGTISGSKLGSHTHDGASILDGTISASKIMDGAVTNEKIAGTIGVEKLATYARTKIVHTGPADNVNTFNSINAAAMALIGEGGGVVKIMPGTYVEDLANFYSVTLEGSGPQNTILRGNTVAHWYSGGQQTMRNLTMDFAYVNGQYGIDAANVVFTGDVLTLYRMNLKSSTIRGHVYIGNFYGFVNSTIDDTTIENGLEMCNTRDPLNLHTDTRILIRNSTLSGTNGLFLRQSVNVKVLGSTITGTDAGVRLDGYGCTNRLEVVGSTISGPVALNNYANLYGYFGNTQLAGTINEGALNAFKLVNCFDGDFNPIANR